MADFDAYIEEAVEMVGEQRKKIPSGESSKISNSYHTGYIYGLRASKLIFKEYEQKSRGEEIDVWPQMDDLDPEGMENE